MSDIARAVDTVIESLRTPGTVTHEIAQDKGGWRVDGNRVSNGLLILVRIPESALVDIGPGAADPIDLGMGDEDEGDEPDRERGEC